VFVSVRRRLGVFALCSEGLFWVAFVAQALEGFSDASANVTFRLPKAAPKRDVLVAVK